MVPMSRAKRSDDWGFPAGAPMGRAARRKRFVCATAMVATPPDNAPPKSPNSPERWYFCEAHAAEYNRGWDYFAEPERRGCSGARRRGGAGRTQLRRAQHYGWGGPGRGSRSADEMRALEVFGLDSDADFDAAKKAWRACRECHPDVKPGDADAAKRFAAGQAAFEVLKQAEDRRAGSRPGRCGQGGRRCGNVREPTGVGLILRRHPGLDPG